MNADFADVLRNDPNTPNRTSDRDPLVAFFSFPPDADMTAEASSASGAVVSYMALATDVDGGAVEPQCAPPSGAVFPVGTTVVQCVAGDGSGNSASARFNVTVNAATSLAGVMFGAGQVGHGATATTFAFHVKETASGLDRGWLYLLARHPGHNDRFFAMHMTASRSRPARR